MQHTYFTPPEIAGQGVKAVHPYPFVANEDNHILGRFDSEYAYANFPKIQLNPEHLYAAIILDVDHPSDSGWPGGTPTPAPSWLVLNTRAKAPTRRAGGLGLRPRSTRSTAQRGSHGALELPGPRWSNISWIPAYAGTTKAALPVSIGKTAHRHFRDDPRLP